MPFLDRRTIHFREFFQTGNCCILWKQIVLYWVVVFGLNCFNYKRFWLNYHVLPSLRTYLFLFSQLPFCYSKPLIIIALALFIWLFGKFTCYQIVYLANSDLNIFWCINDSSCIDKDNLEHWINQSHPITIWNIFSEWQMLVWIRSIFFKD